MWMKEFGMLASQCDFEHNTLHTQKFECFHNGVEMIVTIIGYCQCYNANNAPMQAAKKTAEKKKDNPHLT